MPNFNITPPTQWNKHVSFRLSGGGIGYDLTMPINPDQIQTDSPVRQTTTQTMGGIYKDIGGIGVRSLTIQGSTGWRKSLLSNLDGLATAKKLWFIYQEYYSRIKVTPDVELLFVNDIEGYCYKITMDDFQTFRTKAEPLIIRYSIPITILQDMNWPVKPAGDVAVVLSQNVSVNVVKSVAPLAPIKPAPIPYTVVSGDTLWAIAAKFYGKDNGKLWTVLAEFNNILSPNLIYPGQVVMVPYR